MYSHRPSSVPGIPHSCNECDCLRRENNLLRAKLNGQHLTDDEIMVLVLKAKITQSCLHIFTLLMKRQFASTDAIADHLYGARPDSDLVKDEGAIIKVFMVKLRKLMKHHFDVAIFTQWGHGYFVTAMDKHKMKMWAQKTLAGSEGGDVKSQ